MLSLPRCLSRWLWRLFAPGASFALAFAFARALGAGVTLVALSACASGMNASVEWRLLVKVATPSTAGPDIVERAARTGGVSARYVAAVSPEWHGIALRCGSEAACADAVQRLKADSSYFVAVERDERRRPHAPASNPS